MDTMGSKSKNSRKTDRWRLKLGQTIGHHLRTRGSQRLVRSIFGPGSGDTPQTAICTVKNGAKFHISTGSYLEWTLYMFGEYEPEFQRFLLNQVNEGDTVIDCGANIGIHTIPLARKVGPTGRVIAVEPIEELADRLSANLLLNELENVSVVRAAVSSAVAQGTIFESPEGSTNRGMASLEYREELASNGIGVNLTTVDHLQSEHSLADITLIKIDVEGHELEVLKGAKETLIKSKPVVCFEWVQDIMIGDRVTQSDIDSYLSDCNYDVVEAMGMMQIARHSSANRIAALD